MHGHIVAAPCVKGDVIGIGMPNTVYTDTLGSAFIGSPPDGPGDHVVLGRMVHPAVSASTLARAMNFGKDAARDRDQLPHTEIQTSDSQNGLFWCEST